MSPYDSHARLAGFAAAPGLILPLPMSSGEDARIPLQ